MRNYKNYSVWKKGHKLTLDVYQIVANYPQQELYSLVSQMKRSSSSIPTNIAEGCGRKSDKDFARFLYNKGTRQTIDVSSRGNQKNAELFNSKIKLYANS